MNEKSKKEILFEKMSKTNNARIIQVNSPESAVMVDLAIAADVAIRNVKNRMGFNLKATEGELLLENFKNSVRLMYESIENMNSELGRNTKEIRRIQVWLYPEKLEQEVSEEEQQ